MEESHDSLSALVRMPIGKGKSALVRILIGKGKGALVRRLLQLTLPCPATAS
jgi:hypothetical protein